ncbi:Tic22-like family protein [Helicosporidium sp. ATCC 50920]|nr:Tic22-like family protein [Helicosporidium sp. ATCC 50920]|eukprot:KDD76042.1 Tic22-like family protein [Helicosporidium sp. ATCC 50920]
MTSVSVASQRPVLELALETTEIRSQLSSIPIYTVVTDSNELVLVDRESGDRHLGLIFFDRSDAEALATTVRSASAALSSRVRVREMPLDELYDHVFERDRTLDDVRPAVDFRMVPARAAVRDALATLEAGGKAAAAFSGVPLFQAGGLVVQNEGQPVTPLFLSKADLDAAVRTATDKARQRRRAQHGEEAGVLGRGAEAGMATDGEEDPLESLEIGIESLESVVQRMQSSLTTEWNNVYFVGGGTMGALAKYANRDISHLFDGSKGMEHAHSEGARRMLEQCRVGGSTGGEDIAAPLSVSSSPASPSSSSIDCSAPILGQIGKLSPASYAAWLATPLPGTPRFFSNAFAESVTKVSWWIVPCVWLPCGVWLACSALGACWPRHVLEGMMGSLQLMGLAGDGSGLIPEILSLLSFNSLMRGGLTWAPNAFEYGASDPARGACADPASSPVAAPPGDFSAAPQPAPASCAPLEWACSATPHALSPLAFVLYFVWGTFLWQITEYSMHRWLFHAPVCGPKSQFLHFLFHGCHHKFPQDVQRLVFPPIPAAAILAGFYALIRAGAGSTVTARAIFAGFLVAYVAYDCSHYAIHAGLLRGRLARRHFEHHFERHDAIFGISSPIVDLLLGTSKPLHPQLAKRTTAVNVAGMT